MLLLFSLNNISASKLILLIEKTILKLSVIEKRMVRPLKHPYKINKNPKNLTIRLLRF